MSRLEPTALFSSRGDDDWATRLADVRVPSWYRVGALGLVIAWFIRGRLDKREWTKAGHPLERR